VRGTGWLVPWLKSNRRELRFGSVTRADRRVDWSRRRNPPFQAKRNDQRHLLISGLVSLCRH
jgi:hypothetical protein